MHNALIVACVCALSGFMLHSHCTTDIVGKESNIYLCIGMKGESESVSVFIETRPCQRPASGSMSRKEEDIAYGEMHDMLPRLSSIEKAFYEK